MTKKVGRNPGTAIKRQMVKGFLVERKSRNAALGAVGMGQFQLLLSSFRETEGRVLNAALVADINKIRCGRAAVYGYRKVTMALRVEGLTINAKKVLRHLRVLGLTQPRKVKGQWWSRPALVKPTLNNVYPESDVIYVWMVSIEPMCRDRSL